MLSAGEAVVAAGAAYVAFVVSRWLARRESGDRLIAINAGPLSMALSSIWPPKGWLGNYWAHFIPFEKEGTTVIPCIFPLTAQRYIHVGDAVAMKLVMNDRHGFVKNTKMYALIKFFGDNIVGTEGDTWVRHRSIARKSFGERNNALLWVETLRILNDWFTVWDADIAAHPDRRIETNVTEDLRDITLFVIASAGFGLQFSRKTMGESRPGYTMPFGETLFTAIDTMFTRVLTPRILYSLPIRRLKKSETAYTELQRYIKGMISEARVKGQGIGEGDSSEAADLFRRLVEANDSEDGARLTDNELLSNIYVFFLAGHETSAHTLTFAFALLAMHADVQEKMYAEAKRLWPDSHGDLWSSSKIVDYNRLEYALAVFRETLRLFPAEVGVTRFAVNDGVLPCQTRNASGVWEPSRVSVQAGTPCVLDIHAVHMSPLYWGGDAEAFRPERFIDTPEWEWPRDAWVPFTGGPHVCLGQRFATVESVCILARMVRKYRFSPTPDVAKLPKVEQWARLTKWTVGVTATPGPVHLALEPREG